MNAYVRLNEVDQGPGYFQVDSIQSVTSYGDGSQIYVGWEMTRYTIEENPDVVYKLMVEAEADRRLKMDQIDFERSEAMKERDNASTLGV